MKRQEGCQITSKYKSETNQEIAVLLSKKLADLISREMLSKQRNMVKPVKN